MSKHRCHRWFEQQQAVRRPETPCAQCGHPIPLSSSPGGMTKKYCSFRCKERARHKRARGRLSKEERVALRARTFAQTKSHPDRYIKHLASGRQARANVREWLAAYKVEHGCVDCGYRGHPAALQLDHEGPKSVSIADARSSIPRLMAEIERGECKVRCANCHSIKTWERKKVGVVARKEREIDVQSAIPLFSYVPGCD